MMFKRVHDKGTESLLAQYVDGWRIRLHLNEADQNPLTIPGYLSPNLQSAKRLADAERLRLGLQRVLPGLERVLSLSSPSRINPSQP
jgi:hypothetical protein